MASKKDLIALILKVAQQTPEGVNDHHEDLIKLIDKISCTTAKVHIDIDYDGREFYWKVPLVNPSASEWIQKSNK